MASHFRFSELREKFVVEGSFAGVSEQTIQRRATANRIPGGILDNSCYFDAIKQSHGGEPDSEYIPGTNQIVIASDITNEADRKRLLLHEQLHYASNLGGGDPSNMRWRDETGQPILNVPNHLHSGCMKV